MLAKEKLKDELDKISDELSEKVFKLINIDNRKAKSAKRLS